MVKNKVVCYVTIFNVTILFICMCYLITSRGKAAAARLYQPQQYLAVTSKTDKCTKNKQPMVSLNE